ncbi:hypothetical protein B0H11DRAFT_2206979 [Mycena galericulata]|nr:hypothetical protein B0H11DRAFT_2206979 [Mycena galericulata]
MTNNLTVTKLAGPMLGPRIVPESGSSHAISKSNWIQGLTATIWSEYEAQRTNHSESGYDLLNGPQYLEIRAAARTCDGNGGQFDGWSTERFVQRLKNYLTARHGQRDGRDRATGESFLVFWRDSDTSIFNLSRTSHPQLTFFVMGNWASSRLEHYWFSGTHSALTHSKKPKTDPLKILEVNIKNLAPRGPAYSPSNSNEPIFRENGQDLSSQEGFS